MRLDQPNGKLPCDLTFVSRTGFGPIVTPSEHQILKLCISVRRTGILKNILSLADNKEFVHRSMFRQEM